MALTGRQIEVVEVEIRYRSLYELGNRGATRVPEGFSKITARCLACQDEWRAQRGVGPGQFSERIGQIGLWCPGCGAEESFRNADLNSAFQIE